MGTHDSIQNIAQKLQTHIDVSCVLNEWKAMQADGYVAGVNKEQIIEHYWNEIFALKSVTNTNRYFTPMHHQI